MPKEELLEEVGIPLTPVRLKCAILGLGVLKVALHKAKGTPLPEEWGTSAGRDHARLGRVPEIEVCPLEELPPGRMGSSPAGAARRRRLQLRRRAVRARGPLLARRRAALRGRLGAATSASSSARGTARASTSRSGRPLTLPAYLPVETYPVSVRDGMVVVDVPG